MNWPESVREYNNAKRTVQRTTMSAYVDMDMADAAIEDLKAKYVIDMDDLRGALDAMTVKRDRAVARAEQAEGEAAKWIQAVGLASTALPEMEIDTSDPIGIMQQVVAEVGRLSDQVDRYERCVTDTTARAEKAEAEVERLKLDLFAARRASDEARMTSYQMQDKVKRAEDEVERLKDGLVRIVQCRYHNLTIEDENGQHVVDAYYAPDVLAIVHEVFPDFSAWNESRWAEREEAHDG